ncbi:methylmalonyl Co-A mutase-associated GTPase MeaB [uncultured Cohaesibacter sp.]|uniref:methylmalonyl Co-A mutase-associated GTPase MeaB n=1 Tax=uncultured Cohaesibacter sp. TaxID=1002546 RepID=UPI00292F7F5F|nr:methylmalonyl Co-A mutase-associated GTPase MeaB [uncultured Cohaesibacter sp.]
MAPETEASSAPTLHLEAIRQGGKKALARALSQIEAKDGSQEVATLLDEAVACATAHVVGLTGPPGVGKSTLINALIRQWRKNGERVGVLAVDPSSRFSMGALLGDRTRLDTDPLDQNIFVRSMAARDRLGGLSHEAVAAIVLMRALFDRVLVESVGIGQSEADIAFAVDSVVLCIQPGSGDSLQFMKAGVMELPDIIAVTKADMEGLARCAKADVEGALSLSKSSAAHWRVPVLLISALKAIGLEQLTVSVDDHLRYLKAEQKLAALRESQQKVWLADRIRRKFGEVGLAQVDIETEIDQAKGPFKADQILSKTFLERLSGPSCSI